MIPKVNHKICDTGSEVVAETGINELTPPAFVVLYTDKPLTGKL
jgi:hypothetical protein